MAKRNKPSLLVLVAMAAVVFLSVQVKSAVAAGSYTTDMQEAVRKEVNASLNLGPGLIRLLFHDCFVNGCDGSVLLMSSPGKPTERDSGFNIGLRGFEVINNIRKNLGPIYNITCTDAVIYAAREAVYLLSNTKIAYNVDGPGRKDGVISRQEDPGKQLPGTGPDFAALVEKFTDKNFTEKDVIALSGAHAVGVTHSSNINVTGTPEMYKAAIVQETAKDLNAVKNNVRDFDQGLLSSGYRASKEIMLAKGVLDNSFYNAILQTMAPFPSDRVLALRAKTTVEAYMKDADMWKKDFSNAMEKLSKLAAPQGALSQTRTVCEKTNN